MNALPTGPEPHSAPSALSAGLRCRCPRCGKGRLFAGFLTLRPNCESCGFNYNATDAADGPAFFVMSIVGFVIVGMAMWVEFTYTPPFWLHLVLWLPLTVILSLALIRPAKGLMIAVQYRHKAQEERFR